MNTNKETNAEADRKTSLDDRIALIYTDVQKLTKHFKLDRRAKSGPDDHAEAPDAATEESSKLLREILERIGGIGKIADRKEFTAEQTKALNRIENTVDRALRDFQNSGYRELKSLLETIRQRTDELKTEKQDSIVTHHHRHAIDIVSSKVFLSMVVMVVTMLGLSCIIGNQRRTIDKFRENDLKYRYIRMKGSATPKDVLMLREVFEFNRNADSIRFIRKRVELYERIIQEQAEKEARARLSASEAERLHNEAETVKEGK